MLARSSESCAPHQLMQVGRVVALWLGLLLGWVLATPFALARDPGDHERARAAVRSGEVMPLPLLLERLQRTHPGQVLELDLEQEDGRWIYEVKLLQADGQLLKLELDARSAELLKLRRRDRGGRSAGETHR